MSNEPPDPSTYEGEEGTPPPNVSGPVRYQPQPAAPTPDAQVTSAPQASGPVAHERSGPPGVGERLAAASGPISLILFFVCGFALGGWAWSWVFFLLPGVFYAWNRGDGRDG